MGYRRLADTDAFKRVHYEAKTRVSLDDETVARGGRYVEPVGVTIGPAAPFQVHLSRAAIRLWAEFMARPWSQTDLGFDQIDFHFPPRREMAPWLRMRAEMATARREIL